MNDWEQSAKFDASNTVTHFMDQIIEHLINKGKASNDLGNDYEYGDDYHHEHHVEIRIENPNDAANLLEYLEDHKEKDRGLWDGEEPLEALYSQAAYTYSNAVMYYWKKLIEKINQNDEIFELLKEEDIEPEKIREVIKSLI